MYTKIIIVKKYDTNKYLFTATTYPFRGYGDRDSYRTTTCHIGDIELAKLMAFGISGHDDGDIIWRCDE